MKYESPIICDSKDMANVKVFEVGQTSGSRSNILVPIKRSCDKEYTYEI
jgi:hypothetical protein